MTVDLEKDSTSLIFKILPQRYPFLMVDKILSHDFKVSAECLKNVTHGEEVLVGHFPGNPIYPGVLLIEMGLQASHVMMTDFEEIDSKDDKEPVQGFVLKVDGFKFFEVVRPGDVLKIKAVFDTEAMGMTKIKIEIRKNDDVKVAKGKVTVGVK